MEIEGMILVMLVISLCNIAFSLIFKEKVLFMVWLAMSLVLLNLLIEWR